MLPLHTMASSTPCSLLAVHQKWQLAYIAQHGIHFLGGNFFMDLGDGFNAEECIVGDCGGDVGVMVCPLQSWQTTLGLFPSMLPGGTKKM